jgi:hypothetical protein
MLSANSATVIILFLNALWLVKYSPKTRIWFNSAALLICYVLITIGCFYDFKLVIVGAFFAGVGSAWGQVIHYGFIRRFPSEFVGPFSSGTGISGILGSFIYLILNNYQVENFIIFAILIPIVFIYLINFLKLHSLAESHNYFASDSMLTDRLIENTVPSPSKQASFI